MIKIDGETEQQTAVRNFVYVFCKELGIIWLVKKIPFLELKPQYKLRDRNVDGLK